MINQCMGCQAKWPANERSHTVVDGYPHERVRCTADRYEDLTTERDQLRAEVERLRSGQQYLEDRARIAAQRDQLRADLRETCEIGTWFAEHLDGLGTIQRLERLAELRERAGL